MSRPSKTLMEVSSQQHIASYSANTARLRRQKYVITDGSSQLMLECGLAWKKIQQKVFFKTSAIAGLLVSHEHGDHFRGVKEAARGGMDIYLSAGTAKAVGIAGHRIHHIKAKQQFDISSWSIMPFSVEHDAAEPLGFLLSSKWSGGKLLFLTDSSYVRYRFSGLSHIMIECNFPKEILERNIEKWIVEDSRRKRLLRSHFSLGRVKDFLKANDLSRLHEIHLIHLSDANSDNIQFKREIQSLTGIPVVVC